MQIKILRCCKLEEGRLHDEDASGGNVKRGLFAVSDGAGTGSYAHEWSQVLVKHAMEEPLRSAAPAEVSWWLARARERFVKEVPPVDPASLLPHLRNTARRGAFATLQQVSFVRAENGRLSAQCLSIGDTCTFVRRTRTNGSAVDMHPWMAESDFDRGPLLLPSSLDEFNPYTRIVSHCEFDDLQVGDQIVIATDAVARWLTPRREDGAAWETLGVIADDVAWKQWIEQQRDAHMIGNDDSTLVLLVVEEADLSASGVLASAPPQPFDSAREIELGKALESGQSLAIAEAWGDGVWLGDQLPSFVDQVAPHLKIFEGIHALRRVLIGFHQDVTTFAEVESAWLLHRVALADATVATGIRQALQEIGVKTKLPPAVVLAEPVAESLSEELPALVEALELSPAVVQAEPVAESLSEELPVLVEALEPSPAVAQAEPIAEPLQSLESLEPNSEASAESSNSSGSSINVEHHLT